jgi:hypothetical protein
MMLFMLDEQRDRFQGLVTGEPRETETLMRGSEAGRQKSAQKVTRWRSSLRHGHRGAVVVGGWESQLHGEALQEWVSGSEVRSDERKDLL